MAERVSTSLNEQCAARVSLGLVFTLASACVTETAPIERTRSHNPDAGADVSKTCDDPNALSLFERKIEPLFSDDHPSSCGQCHLPGVDFQAFARGSACETYACLAEKGLVDKDDPEDSLVLSWIGRAEPDSKLITEEVISQELDAFSQWLTYVQACNACEGATCGTARKSCAVEPEPLRGIDPTTVDLGGCEAPRLEALFRDAVYVYRNRCAPCHINDHEDATTPMWIEATFDCAESLTRTYNNVQRNGYLNLDTPERSLLLLKPLTESQGGVVHGGGDKFADKTDPAYVSFLYFIERLSHCLSGQDED
jgi:hypothetical protein